ncbi:o-succinylbenzoate--CoA ligase [Geobacillus icigianus]|uniref:2-succinylbenzoate--CoA ligase n=1 Tax=Geobacillus subterraneus TaxID=129338 RepID=A0A679FVW1_9BACL|nr:MULTISPECIES: o-succinylbenzoate--CoA ligase [Geobacillus]KYD27077.1 O-succinylbenzoic acid--CoA ligase [Geobacillus sp. B4113_201601]BBW98845.1 2-succinylbenzoate--CoA ligase [Geobacillus subterraneus]
MTMMPNWLKQRAFLTPERVAVSDGKRSKTFAALHEAAAVWARRLARVGVKEGEIVALLMKNRIEMVELVHALFFLGARVLLLNVRLTAYELGWQLDDSGARLVIADNDLAGRLGGDGRVLSVEELAALPEAEVDEKETCDLDDVATIMYTSGTTGAPKGVMQTYGNHWWSAVGSALNLGVQENDCWLAAVPLFHISGLSIVMRSVIYGMPMRLQPSFDPEEANDWIMRGEVTVMSVVAAMLQRLLAVLGDARYPDTFRCMLLGGGPAPRPLLEACKDKGIPVYQTYGMTETASQIVTLAPEYSLTKLGSAGKPLFPAQLRIENDGKTAAPYEAGEIVVKGPNVTKGYWRRPEATAAAIRDGWLYTGDIGYLDEEGFLYVLDRRSDLIISGGENVYPAEIEAVLLSHPDVEEAGVTGIEDETWGQVPCAFVRLKPGAAADEEALRAFCRARLAKYKVPARIYFVNRLPRNAAQKLLRRELKTLIPAEEKPASHP